MDIIAGCVCACAQIWIEGKKNRKNVYYDNYAYSLKSKSNKHVNLTNSHKKRSWTNDDDCYDVRTSGLEN